MTELSKVIESRKEADPRSSYVASLYAKGTEAMAEKVTEEAGELVDAARNGDRDHVVYEAADLWFHSLILLSQFDLNQTQVLEELHRRFGMSGLKEKSLRSDDG